MRDGDRARAAPPTQLLYRALVDDGHAIPQHVASWGRNQERALADGEGRLGADAEQAEVVVQLVSMFLPQLLERRPTLARPADVLPLVVTDRTAFRRVIDERELHAARRADKTGHGCRLDDTQPAIWARELNPSLFRMLRTWLSTVRSEMKRRAPICLLLRPSATRLATSASRAARSAPGSPAE